MTIWATVGLAAGLVGVWRQPTAEALLSYNNPVLYSQRVEAKRAVAAAVYAGLNPVALCYSAGETDAQAAACLRGAARAARKAAEVLVEVLGEESGR